ncbi:acyltransferase family protein [Massilia sp. TWR1-2-2]|uniref:acyltransferase family protein n=1 Tax=Massilia sp. TWR1-2-2 TaxID=2804584 RepID=UPI003CEA6921
MTATSPPKLAFIEGMRGIAACQVVLLHYCAALLPVLARVGGAGHFESEQELARSPLFALIDGYSAVYLFFVMSGFVLAGSFLRAPRAFPVLATKRLLRLFLPVAAAFAIGVLLFAALPQARAAALKYAGSDWLAALGRNDLSGAALLRDGLLNSMLIGYQGSSIFAGAPGVLAPAPMGDAINAPTWTLHAEFWGSMLVLALALAYRRMPALPFWCGCAVLAVVLGTSHFSLFVLGFFLYTQQHALLSARGRLASWSGALLFVLGVTVCVAKDNAALAAVDAAARALGVASAQSDFHWQSQAGAALMFIGAVLSAPLRRVFSCAPAQWLGKLSFSVYLLHFPILLTVGCLVFASLAPASYALAVLLSLVAGVGLTFVAAVVFERHIDRRAVLWSRKIGAVRLQPLPQ